MKVIIDATEAYDVPEYQSAGASGVDLHASNKEPIRILPNERKLIPTGLKMKIEDGFEGQIRPRSGLVYKHGITVANSPGTIDSDYRGNIGVILHNISDQTFYVNTGDRIAQVVFAKSELPEFAFEVVEEDTDRGSGGYGHTGNN